MIHNKDVLRFLRSLLSIPEGSHGVFVDHRPFKYFTHNLMDITHVEKHVPTRVFPERRKIKVLGRYVYVVHPDNIPMSTCGHQFQTVGIERHTSINSYEKAFLASRMRGEHLDRQEAEALLLN